AAGTWRPAPGRWACTCALAPTGSSPSSTGGWGEPPLPGAAPAEAGRPVSGQGGGPGHRRRAAPAHLPRGGGAAGGHHLPPPGPPPPPPGGGARVPQGWALLRRRVRPPPAGVPGALPPRPGGPRPARGPAGGVRVERLLHAPPLPPRPHRPDPA